MWPAAHNAWQEFHFCKYIKVLSSYEFNNDKVTPRFGSYWRSYDWWFFSTGVLTVFVIGQSLYQVSISVPQYNGQWRLQSDSEASRYTLCESVSSIIIFISTLQPEARPACSPITKWPIQIRIRFQNILTTWCIVLCVIIYTKWVKVGAIYLDCARHGGDAHTFVGRLDYPQSG